MCVVEARHIGCMGPFSKIRVARFESTLPSDGDTPALGAVASGGRSERLSAVHYPRRVLVA